MKAVRFEAPDGTVRLGALEGEIVRDVEASIAGGFIPTPEAWELLAAADGTERNLDELRLLHPVEPGKIIGIGVNYRAHAEESGNQSPDAPVVFAKWPSSLVGPDAPIIIPREETRPDWEGEVAVVIGRRIYRADASAARAGIGGITALNDVSGRRASSRRRCASSPSARVSTPSLRWGQLSRHSTGSTWTTSACGPWCRASSCKKETHATWSSRS
jgi:2-keto-4-pentenoate hydratase/2-oxohepta-3-ene-1,7-dioic acid hydratase in catechol pathway